MKTVTNLVEKARNLQIDQHIDGAYRNKLCIGTGAFLVTLFDDGSAMVEGKDKGPKPLRTIEEINEYAYALQVATKWIGGAA